MKRLRFQLITAITAVTVCSRADLLVSYGMSTDYVTANQNFQRGNNNGAAFSTAAMSPAANYTGPVFFGGYAGNTAMGVHAVANNAAADQISVGSGTTTVGTYSTLLAMFALESPSTVTQVVWSVVGSGVADSQTNLVSIVVQKNNSYYISEQMSRRSTVYVTNSALDSLMWYNYDPAVSLLDKGTVVEGFTLDNITAIGEWAESLVTVAGGTSSVIVRKFEASGTVIPEPATISMLGFGALVAIVCRRTVK